jgi:hypothetical protein
VFVQGAIFDEHERLAKGRYGRPVEGVTRYDVDIRRKVLVKCMFLGRFD